MFLYKGCKVFAFVFLPSQFRTLDTEVYRKKWNKKGDKTNPHFVENGPPRSHEEGADVELLEVLLYHGRPVCTCLRLPLIAWRHVSLRHTTHWLLWRRRCCSAGRSDYGCSRCLRTEGSLSRRCRRSGRLLRSGIICRGIHHGLSLKTLNRTLRLHGLWCRLNGLRCGLYRLYWLGYRLWCRCHGLRCRLGHRLWCWCHGLLGGNRNFRSNRSFRNDRNHWGCLRCRLCGLNWLNRLWRRLSIFWLDILLYSRTRNGYLWHRK